MTQQFDPLNRLTTAIDWGGTTTFAYSARSELLGKTDPGPLSQAYTYDGNQNRIKLVDPDGGVVTTVFDRLDRVSSVQKQTGQFYTPLYDADSRRTTLQMGVGTIRQYGLDPLGRITTQVDFASSTAIGTFIDTYDPVSNRTNRVQDVGVLYTWTYDNNYRLTGQISTMGYETFSYDSMSNTLVKWQQGQAPQTMVYDRANRLQTSTIGNVITSFSYDNMFQSVEHMGTSLIFYSYDGENRLVTAVYAGGTRSTYTYQGFDGLRRSVAEPNVAVTTLVWAGSDYVGQY